MRKDGTARRTELLRKAVHVGSGLLALLLAWLSWQQALAMALGAFAFNLLLLPRIGGRAMHREDDHARGHAIGILLYPLSVAALILIFRHRLELAAVGWALMAFGDGMASVVGTLWGRHALPWNPRKSWEGVAAHVVIGGATAFVIGWIVAQRSGVAALGPAVFCLAVLIAAVVASLLESLDAGIDDNVLVPLLGAGLAWVVVSFAVNARLATTTEWSDVGRVALPAGAGCLVLAVAAWLARSLTAAGAGAAALLGTVVAAFGGWGQFAALCAFFVVGVSATRLGRKVKEARGIAEARGGRRGVGNVLANGGAAGLLALAGWAGVHGLRALAVACALAALGALATAAFDTASSEIGKAWGRTTVLVTSLRPVPPGTEGAVSLEGTLAGLVAAAIVACVGAPFTPLGQTVAPLKVVLCVVAAGFVGSTFESIVGAMAHRRGRAIHNDVLNFANTVVGAVAAALGLGLLVLTEI